MSANTSTPRRRGRQPDASSKSGQIRELLKTGLSAGEIAKKLNCTPALVYNVKARLGGGAKKRGPGRPAKSNTARSSSLEGIDGILEAVRGAERERAQLRTALQKIQSLVADALG